MRRLVEVHGDDLALPGRLLELRAGDTVRQHVRTVERGERGKEENSAAHLGGHLAVDDGRVDEGAELGRRSCRQATSQSPGRARCEGGLEREGEKEREGEREEERTNRARRAC